jgi:hypothetical protein
VILIALLFGIGFTFVVVGLFAELDLWLTTREERKHWQARPMRSLYVSPSGRELSPWVERVMENKFYADEHNGAGRVANKDLTERMS